MSILHQLALTERIGEMRKEHDKLLWQILAGKEFQLLGCRVRATIEWLDEKPLGTDDFIARQAS